MSLISTPVSARVRADYRFESVAIDDSDMVLFAIYRDAPQKQDLIQAYIQDCRALLIQVKQRFTKAT